MSFTFAEKLVFEEIICFGLIDKPLRLEALSLNESMLLDFVGRYGEFSEFSFDFFSGCK